MSSHSQIKTLRASCDILIPLAFKTNRDVRVDLLCMLRRSDVEHVRVGALDLVRPLKEGRLCGWQNRRQQFWENSTSRSIRLHASGQRARERRMAYRAETSSR